MGIEIVDVASDFVHTVDDVEIYGRNDKVGLLMWVNIHGYRILASPGKGSL